MGKLLTHNHHLFHLNVSSVVAGSWIDVKPTSILLSLSERLFTQDSTLELLVQSLLTDLSIGMPTLLLMYLSKIFSSLCELI